MVADDSVQTSQTLLRQLGSPDKHDEAWRTFLERYRPMILRCCRRLGLRANDADEVSAAVLTKLLGAMKTYVQTRGQRFRSWLLAVVANEVHSYRRWQGRHLAELGSGDPDVHAQLENVPAAVSGLADALDASLDRDLRQAEEVMARVQARVGRRAWDAYWMTAIDKVRGPEAAAKLNMSVAAVYMAKRRVGQMLRDEGMKLQAQGKGPQGGAR